ncbi:primosomal protein DnaI [Alteribacter keqinensis]|uniref:Primosomal protein DnaI n=1 Tax=Alteribacter keqinensis TaxID=2483800 RepID=A0A3M7U0U8_9BACI|nr:primosomal protein DnaI [Alteribacter keqinensis]RNA70305.1 primosomal protein DnaI [Alteribacter keqinensis]
MEPIGRSIRKLSGGNFEKRLEALMQEVLEDSRIQAFLSKQNGLTEAQIERHLNDLFQYKKEWANCDRCPGLENCPNLMQGYQPELKMYRDDIQVSYHPCPLKKKSDERKRQASFIKSLYIPKEIVAVTFKDIDQDNASRVTAIKKALQFSQETKPGEDGKGLYITGSFGVGKTYLMGAVSNALAEREIESMIIYTPDFFRELKQGITDGSYQDKLETVKRVPVLILDDIGAETMSAWVRDDILGALLQYRMMEKLPTVFTSNYDLDELETHLTYTNRGGVENIEVLKAKRIMERIRHLNEEIAMKGTNRRTYNA